MNCVTTIVVIPARMASTRLPGKPLAEIGGVPMIVHVWRRAVAAHVGPVWVACAELEIAAAVERAGGEAVMTGDHHASGSDRVREAVHRIGVAADVVINLQGDCPSIEPEALRSALLPLDDDEVDIATLVAETYSVEARTNPNIVKAVLSLSPGGRTGRALYFSRAAVPSGEGPLYHHGGIYAFRRAALDRFVSLPPSRLERRENLEQLRALEAGMRIDAALVDSIPPGVDTPADLERMRRHLAP